jgi:hypothetical protein
VHLFPLSALEHALALAAGRMLGDPLALAAGRTLGGPLALTRMLVLRRRCHSRRRKDETRGCREAS